MARRAVKGSSKPLDAPYRWALTTLLVASAVLKLYHLTVPAVDWQSWNQITTLANARYILREGWAAFVAPQVDLLRSLQPGSDVMFGEMPLLHTLMAAVYALIGGEAEWAGRLWNVAFSLLGAVYLVRLGQRTLPPLALVAGVGVYCLSPMNLYFHRTLMTDVPMMAFTIAGLYHFVRWLETDRRAEGVYAGAAVGAAALFKPYALFMGVALLYLIVARQGWRRVLRPWHLLVAAVAVAPVAAWLAHGQFLLPRIAPGYENLAQTAGLLGPWRILVDGDYYRHLWAIVMDFTLTPLFAFFFLYAGALALGRWGARLRERWRAPWSQGAHVPGLWPDWLSAWLAGIVAYLVLVRQGNLVHDYYQMPLLPPAALMAGVGFDHLWRRLRPVHTRPGLLHLSGKRAILAVMGESWQAVRRWRWGKRVVGVLVVLTLVYAGFRTYGKHRLSPDSYHAGRAVAAVREAGERTLVAEIGGLRHNQLLHYTGGKGWWLPRDARTFADLRPYYAQGARFVAVSMRSRLWEQDHWPRPVLRELAATGHLELLQRSDAQTDRYGRRRTWAVYRLRPPAQPAAAGRPGDDPATDGAAP